MLILGKRFEVRKAYPKGAQGVLVNDLLFIDDLNKYLIKNIRDACARNNNPRPKPKSSDTNSDLIYKPVFANFLYLTFDPPPTHPPTAPKK